MRPLNETEKRAITTHFARKLKGGAEDFLKLSLEMGRVEYRVSGRFTQCNLAFAGRIRFSGAAHRSRDDRKNVPLIGEAVSLHRALENGWVGEEVRDE